MDKNDILFNEYKELTIFRERSIHSIETSVNGYTTFLGFVLTALTLFIAKDNLLIKTKETALHISIFVGFLFFLYGLKIFRLIYVSHENLVIYTRQLNITRKLIIGNDEEIVRQVFLKTTWKTEKFDEFGHEKKKFSKEGALGIIKIINSLVISIVVFGFIFSIMPRGKYETLVLFTFAFFSFLASKRIHNDWIISLIGSSKNQWNEMMKSEKYSEYLEK